MNPIGILIGWIVSSSGPLVVGIFTSISAGFIAIFKELFYILLLLKFSWKNSVYKDIKNLNLLST